MDPTILTIIFFTLTLSLPASLQVDAAPKITTRPTPQITVMGAEVRIDCKFNADSPRTPEEILLSVNRTTNRHGVYKLDIPSVDGIQCAAEEVGNSFRARLIRSTSLSCNVPGYRSTSHKFSQIKTRQPLHLQPLCFKLGPSKRDLKFCGH